MTIKFHSAIYSKRFIGNIVLPGSCLSNYKVPYKRYCMELMHKVFFHLATRTCTKKCIYLCKLSIKFVHKSTALRTCCINYCYSHVAKYSTGKFVLECAMVLVACRNVYEKFIKMCHR
jgi:hypothetical protein